MESKEDREEREKLENEILDALDKKILGEGEIETKDMKEYIKKIHTDIYYSKITPVILTLIDEDRLELTKNLCLKL